MCCYLGLPCTIFTSCCFLRRAVEQPQKLEQEQEELEDTKPESSTNHMDFEDDDEDSVPMMMTPTRGRTPGALKGSARKKTTSLQETLANMRRHRIEEKEYNEEKKS